MGLRATYHTLAGTKSSAERAGQDRQRVPQQGVRGRRIHHGTPLQSSTPSPPVLRAPCLQSANASQPPRRAPRLVPPPDGAPLRAPQPTAPREPSSATQMWHVLPRRRRDRGRGPETKRRRAPVAQADRQEHRDVPARHLDLSRSAQVNFLARQLRSSGPKTGLHPPVHRQGSNRYLPPERSDVCCEEAERAEGERPTPPLLVGRASQQTRLPDSLEETGAHRRADHRSPSETQRSSGPLDLLQSGAQRPVAGRWTGDLDPEQSAQCVAHRLGPQVSTLSSEGICRECSCVRHTRTSRESFQP